MSRGNEQLNPYQAPGVLSESHIKPITHFVSASQKELQQFIDDGYILLDRSKFTKEPEEGQEVMLVSEEITPFGRVRARKGVVQGMSKDLITIIKLLRKSKK